MGLRVYSRGYFKAVDSCKLSMSCHEILHIITWSYDKGHSERPSITEQAMWREESSVASFSLPKSVALLFKQAQKLTADLKFRLPKHDSVLALSVLLGKNSRKGEMKRRDVNRPLEKGAECSSVTVKKKNKRYLHKMGIYTDAKPMSTGLKSPLFYQ